METFPGSERTLASMLNGLGFKVFRIDGTFMIQGSKKLWGEVFEETDPVSREVTVPEDMASMVERVILLRTLADPDSN